MCKGCGAYAAHAKNSLLLWHLPGGVMEEVDVQGVLTPVIICALHPVEWKRGRFPTGPQLPLACSTQHELARPSYAGLDAGHHHTHPSWAPSCHQGSSLSPVPGLSPGPLSQGLTSPGRASHTPSHTLLTPTLGPSATRALNRPPPPGNPTSKKVYHAHPHTCPPTLGPSASRILSSPPGSGLFSRHQGQSGQSSLSCLWKAPVYWPSTWGSRLLVETEADAR